MTSLPEQNSHEPRKRLSALAIILIVLALVAAAAIIIASLYVFMAMGDIALGLHGWLALIAGGLGSVLLGGGLMALSFYSSRSGHDEKAHDENHDLKF